MAIESTSGRARLFGPLPTRGIWTALDLTRAQFLWILACSVLLFVFVDGPLWRYTRASHFNRIAVSYAFIPVAVAWALYRNGKARPLPIAVATVVVSVVKLVVTAVLLIAIGLAQT